MVMKSTLAALLGCLSLMPTFAADVTIPHTFSSGTPARAAEVNANFTALKNGTDANSTAIDGLRADLQALALSMRGGLQVQVNGATIGAFFGLDEEGNLLALTAQGYFVDLIPDKANETAGAGSALNAASIDFDAANCQGNMYVTGIAMFNEHSIFYRQGIVFGAPGPGGSTVARVAKGEPSQVTLYSTSYLDDSHVWRCDNFNDGNGDVSRSALAIAPTLNDPAVTGVPNNLSGPVRITR
jgi:hypothetical protein